MDFFRGQLFDRLYSFLDWVKKPFFKEKSVKKEESAFKIPFHLWLLLISCALNAIGFLPHTLFWVDYLIRHLNISPTTAGTSWALLVLGPRLAL